MNLLLLLPLRFPYFVWPRWAWSVSSECSPLAARSRWSPPSSQASVIADLLMKSLRAAL